MKKDKANIIILFFVFIIALIIINDISLKRRIVNGNMRTNEKVLFIPKINLMEVLNDDINKLDYRLIYYNNFDINNKIIIFGHSKVGYGIYFNRLDELKIGDISYLYYKRIEYKYEVINIYDVKKEDIFILENEYNSYKLLLITCNKKIKNNRLVIELKLKSAKNLKK